MENFNTEWEQRFQEYKESFLHKTTKQIEKELESWRK